MFGSDGNGGGRGQACKQTRLLFLAVPHLLIPITVQLPPTSLSAARKFFLQLSSEGLAYWTVLMRIGLETAKNSQGIGYSKATFALLSKLPPELANRFRAMGQALLGNGEATGGEMPK